jgi:hypothetical protein
MHTVQSECNEIHRWINEEMFNKCELTGSAMNMKESSVSVNLNGFPERKLSFTWGYSACNLSS